MRTLLFALALAALGFVVQAHAQVITTVVDPAIPPTVPSDVNPPHVQPANETLLIFVPTLVDVTQRLTAVHDLTEQECETTANNVIAFRVGSAVCVP